VKNKHTPVNQKGSLRRVLAYVRPQWPLVVLALLLSLLTVGLTLAIPILIGQAIDCIVSSGQVDFPRLTTLLFVTLGCVAASALFQWLCGIISNRLTYRTVGAIRQDAFTHFQQLPLKYLDAHPVGDLVSRMIADVDTFADGLLMGFTQLFTGVMTILGTLGFMLTLSPLITLVVVVLTPLSLFVARFIARKTFSMFQLQSVTRGEQTSLIDEAIGNQKVVLAFDHGKAMTEQFDEINGRLETCSLKATFFSSLVNPVTRFVNALVYAAVALAGGLTVLSGGVLTIGGLTSFLSYANQYTKPFNEISGVVTELQNALACAGRIFDLMDEPAQSPDPQDAPEALNADGQFSLRHVRFSYEPERPLITDLSLEVSPGQRVAIVGPTGCGKTTLINLLMRFYDVEGGQILLDGMDTSRLRRSALRRSVGMVLQDTWLPAGTIREIISFGKPEATEEEIKAAAKASHAHSFIRRLPQGYDTRLSENGGSLSQGQKQLLCITRVMLCLPPVLILDEATSSIDVRTEQRIQAAFSAMMEGRTSFIVAHRLSTIRNADTILVMRDGNVVEQGNHESLLRKNGAYAGLYRAQFEQ
jgi:ATP-binding cassette subfamily B protein